MAYAKRVRKLTVREVAEETGLSLPTIYRYIAQGLIPSQKIGGAIRVPEDRLMDVLEKATRVA